MAHIIFLYSEEGVIAHLSSGMTPAPLLLDQRRLDRSVLHTGIKPVRWDRASRTCGSGDEAGRLRHLRGRPRADGTNQVDEKPDSDNGRPCDRQRDEAAIIDQVSAIECRVLLDPVLHRLFPPTTARCHIAQIGRTSMAPVCAPGQRAAQAIAPSRSGASIR